MDRNTRGRRKDRGRKILVESQKRVELKVRFGGLEGYPANTSIAEINWTQLRSLVGQIGSGHKIIRCSGLNLSHLTGLKRGYPNQVVSHSRTPNSVRST